MKLGNIRSSSKRGGINREEASPISCPDVGYIKRMLGREETIVVLAKDKDVIVGVVGGWLEGTPSGYDVEDTSLMLHNAYHEAHLDWIAVKEEYKEKGIGKALVERVCSWAREKGKKKVWTEASQDTSIFCRKLGFKDVGRFRNDEGDELITMVRRL